MADPTITVGGLPGTGTTTLCKLLEERLGLSYVYAGRLFRDAARERGMSLAEFGAYCQENPEVDQDLDAKQVGLLREGGLILEGRLSGWLAFRERIHALKVWVECDEPHRIRRLVDRDGGTTSEQLDRMHARQASERDRYLRYYGIDLADLRPYELVLDSTSTLPDRLADQVEEALQSHLAALDGSR